MRTTDITKAFKLFPLLTIAALAACVGPVGDDDIDGAGLLADDGAEGDAVGEAQQALVACGDGVQSDGEVCFLPAVKVTDLPSGADAIVSGLMDAGTARDFVATSTTADQIRIKLGNGAGGFSSTYTYTMGDGPTSVALGDFNDDGLKDIITSNFYDDQVRVRWGGGSPNWGSFNSFAVGDGPTRIQAGDLNADGRDDFVTLDGLGDTLTVRLGVAGGFGAASTLASGAFANDVRLADCDNDGDLDMVYASGSGNAGDGAIRVRKNNGAGSFGSPVVTNLGLGIGQSTHSLVVVDLNEDGIKDTVVTLNDHQMMRLLGTGGCGFGSKVTAPTENNPVRIYSADFDKDFNQDLVVAHFNNMKISIYLGHGNGNVSSPVVISPGTWVMDLATGDFNGDGSHDIVFAGLDGVYLLESNP